MMRVSVSSVSRSVCLLVAWSCIGWLEAAEPTTAHELRAVGAAPVLLVENGVARATILTPVKPSEVVLFAAGQLQEYLKKISGATLLIREGTASEAGRAIVLEKDDLDPLRRGLEVDSFAVKCQGNRLRLAGNTDRAVLYAAYAFLESLGAVWLEPGEEGEILPRMQTIVADALDLRFKPAFDLRGVCVYNRGTGKQTLDWMGKMRMNLALYPPPGFQKHGILQMAGTGHDFATRMGLPKDWRKDPANENYVALLKGKRATQSEHVEPCMSNPEALHRLLATSLKFIEDRPDTYIFDMRASDNVNIWCECEKCRDQTPTDIYLKYVNHLAARVHEKWPRKKVSLIAYHNTAFPLRDTSPDLSHENLVLWFAPIKRPYRQPINSVTPGEQTKMEFPLNKAVWPTTDSGWEPILLAWQKVFAGPILVLDYYHWSGLAERRSAYFYTRPSVIAADLKHYHDLGLAGSIGVEPCPSHLPNGWNHYLKAKLLWDPSQSVTDLERQYSELFYGTSAAAALRCLKAAAHVLNAEVDDAENVSKLKEVAGTFVAEVRGCEKTRTVEERLKRITLWLDYVTLRKEYFCRVREKNKEAADQAKAALVKLVESNLTQLTRYHNEIKELQALKQ